MQEVVCFNCGRIVHISPDAELCSVCGENLRELIHPAYASKYFYDRAAAMAAGSDLLQALREIDRGLVYKTSSELRLLGAILSQRIGDFEQMRSHLAAVPVDDILRPEAEWLLRSHQRRQREQRAATRDGRSPTADALPLLDEGETAPPPFDDEVMLPLVPTRQPAVSASHRPTSSPRRPWLVVSLLLILGLVVGSFLWSNDAVRALLPWSTAEQLAGEPADQEIVNPVTVPLTSTPAAPVLQPTVTASNLVPNDLVQVTPEPLAESTVGALLVNPLQPFDLASYLSENSRSDLAALGVVASSQDGTVLLDGIVPAHRARQDLIELMEQAPGVTRVSGANILVRLPATYTVQAGDTLWAISDYFYGEDRIAEIIAANRAVLPSSNLLTIGMELALPPLE